MLRNFSSDSYIQTRPIDACIISFFFNLLPVTWAALRKSTSLLSAPDVMSESYMKLSGYCDMCWAVHLELICLSNIFCAVVTHCCVHSFLHR